MICEINDNSNYTYNINYLTCMNAIVLLKVYMATFKFSTLCMAAKSLGSQGGTKRHGVCNGYHGVSEGVVFGLGPVSPEVGPHSRTSPLGRAARFPKAADELGKRNLKVVEQSAPQGDPPQLPLG